MEDIKTMQEYFTCIDKKFGPTFADRYPQLNGYYQELKSACLKINQDPRKIFFDSVKELLILDAQLQLLLEYEKLTQSNFHEVSSEEEMISQIRKDSHSFYRELVGLKTTSEIPIGIMYLGDRMNEC
ncbi:DUF7006 family protein [Enterococcus sp. NPDC086594]|uniref:DUF7006 family protein n=1 Tax=Enterococcus sp. NPDC086594 TaxID=3363992 RepID=UPI003808AD3E